MRLGQTAMSESLLRLRMLALYNLVLCVYGAAVCTGITVALLAKGIDKLFGIVILAYCAMPWMLLVRLWRGPADFPDRAIYVGLVTGVAVNAFVLWLGRRYLKCRLV